MSAFRSSLRRLALVSSALVALAATAPALAADAGSAASANGAEAADEGAEIIVTARHREERLQDVPVAISAVAGEELSGQHLDRIADYAAKIPNFSAFATNPRVATVNIRGLGGNASNDGAEGGVGVIVDDVFFTHVGFSWLDFVDLESVQVACGPQGTLLGKNTRIGAVIVRTAKPSFDPSLTVTETVANRDRWQIRANATGPLIADKLAARITFSGDTGGGWVTNAYNGDKLLDNNRWAIRGQPTLNPEASRLLVHAYGSREGSLKFGALALGLDRDIGDFRWSTYGRAEWLSAQLDAYSETGGGRMSLRFNERIMKSLSSVLGARFDLTRDTEFGSITPRLRGEWRHEFQDGGIQLLDYADIAGESQYSLAATNWKRDQFSLSVGGSLMLRNAWVFDLDLELRKATGERSGALRGKITKEF